MSDRYDASYTAISTPPPGGGAHSTHLGDLVGVYRADCPDCVELAMGFLRIAMEVCPRCRAFIELGTQMQHFVSAHYDTTHPAEPTA